MKRLRDRAAETLRWLRPMMRTLGLTRIRPNVEIMFVRTKPAIDFKSRHLSRSVADDCLIASVLEFEAEDGDVIAVATDDGGMEMKLPAFGIPHLELPDAMRLKEEPDPLLRENAGLRREIASIKARSPKLELSFVGAEQKHVLKFRVPGMDQLKRPESLAEMKALFPFADLPSLPAPPPGSPSKGSFDLAQFADPAYSEFITNRRYNEDLDKFLSQYEKLFG